MSQVQRNQTWQTDNLKPYTLHTYSIFENIVFLVVGDSTENSNSKVLFVWSSTPFHSLQIYFDLITKPSSVLQKEDKVKKTLLNF